MRHIRKTAPRLAGLLFACAVAYACSFPAPAAQPSAPPPTERPAHTLFPTYSPTPAPTPISTPLPTPTPTPTPTPDPDAQYFAESGEFYEFDPDGKHWAYRSPTLGVSIERVAETRTTGKKKKIYLVYYVADIHVRDFTLIATGFANGKPQGSPNQKPDAVARLYKAVYAQSGDFYTRRASGLIVRGGKVYRNKKQELDTMAISPSGEMLVFPPGAIAKEDISGMGIRDTFNFGPILVENGKIGKMKNRFTDIGIAPLNPRNGFGMVEPGHYIGIVAEGRGVGGSNGCGLDKFAQLFFERGCVTAYNLDGGQTAGMVFMGKAITKSNTGEKKLPSGSQWLKQRPVADILRIGVSGLVPAQFDSYPPPQ